MPIGMPPQGFADQMRQQGQMGPPPGGPPMGAMPPVGQPPMMGEQPDMPDQNDQQVKMLLVAILQLLMGSHNGAPPAGAPGMPGQSPGLPMS